MPNRIIKESICYSESIRLLTSEEECFFYRLLVNCDDYGRFDTRLLKSRLYPLKEVTQQEVDAMLNKINKNGMVKLYSNNGIKYLQMSTWDKHQQIRAKRSKFPACDDDCSTIIEDNNGYQMISDDIHRNQMISNDSICYRNPIQSESNPNPNPNPNPNLNPITKNVSEFFESVWRLYPVKKGKADVSKTQKEKLFKIGYDEIERTIERYLNDNSDTEEKYLKHGSTFFNSGYVDYLDCNYIEPQKPQIKPKKRFQVDSS